LGLDLAVVPSSDWRGIDPLHTQMASVRAIENGFSLLRPTRSGLTAAYDAYGRARAWQSSFDDEEQIVLAAVPRHGISTLYGRIGDVFVGLCAAFTVAVMVVPRMRGR
jgi:apolipoprotein N-acyltransferase